MEIIQKHCEQRILFPEALNWVQQYISRKLITVNKYISHAFQQYFDLN